MIELRAVVSEEDVQAWLSIRARIDPDHPITRANFDSARDMPDGLDLLADLDGEPVGTAWAHVSGRSEASELVAVSVRVLREHRRRGVGSTLFARVSRHARELGRQRLTTVTRDDDVDTLAYLGRRGFVELTRTEDVALDLRDASTAAVEPSGISIVPLVTAHETGMYRVSLEADADVPSPEPYETGSIERWRARELGPCVIRELSFVALDGDEVVGFATLGDEHDGIAVHWMTAVARCARGRGVATALKTRQIAAARAAGLRELRTQNDVANTAMRHVNDRLGYRRRLAWLHLGGPLLDTAPAAGSR